MTGRSTTRAGRKIRHVAPGHVVDVATGLSVRQVKIPTGQTWWLPDGARVSSAGGLDQVIDGIVARAEAVCALVRAMLVIGGAP